MEASKQQDQWRLVLRGVAYSLQSLAYPRQSPVSHHAPGHVVCASGEEMGSYDNPDPEGPLCGNRALSTRRQPGTSHGPSQGARSRPVGKSSRKDSRLSAARPQTLRGTETSLIRVTGPVGQPPMMGE